MFTSKEDLAADIHELRTHMFADEYGITNAALSKRLREVEQKLDFFLEYIGMEAEYEQTVVGLKDKRK